MEIASIASAISSIKTATDIVKHIRDSGSSLEDAEIKLKLADLVGALADSKMEVANFKDLLLEKDSIIQRLQAKLSKELKTVWEDPYYFIVDESGERDGPYCQKCYDGDGKYIRLQSPGRRGYWDCNECKNHYKDSDYKHDSGIRVSARRNSFLDRY